MNIFTKNTWVVIAAASLLFSACKKNEEEEIQPETSTTANITYEFTRNGSTTVDYSGQTTRMDMFDELSKYMASANDGYILSAEVMLNMFKNENSPFSSFELNESTKNIASKVYQADTGLFYNYFQNAELSSMAYAYVASNGQAGLSTSNNQTKTYSVDANGIEWRQVMAKHLMGALLYYQTTSVYLTENKIGASVDNNTLVDGENYTTMEHHFDEAFGYLGVPVDFPINTNNLMFYGEYLQERSVYLNLNTSLMSAFIAGRYAITNKDMVAKDAAINTIKAQWELVIATSAIHYLNEAIANFGDDAIRSHVLSECLGFVKSLKYNIDKTISNADITSVEANIGLNFYAVTINDLNAAKTTLSTAFNLDAIKDNL